MALTVGALKAILDELPDDSQVVFDDDNTEYIYGVDMLYIGADHVALTWDVDTSYIVDEDSNLVKP